jgi:DNA-directed RNA polymerase subunit RPC12/RpoP
MMNRTVAVVVIVISVVLLAAGLLFLCAATRQPSRLLLAGALIVVGAGLAVWSGTTLRRLRDLDPENLSDRITQLARGGDAEVTLSQVVSELGVPDEAAVAALNLLERRGQAYRERRTEREFYIFPGLKPSKVARKCPYCGGEFSVKTPVYRCPHCGGDLRLVKE